MKEELEKKDQLILGYLEGKASTDQAQALAGWVALSDENKKYYQQIKNLWEETDPRNSEIHVSRELAFEKVLDRIDQPAEKKRLLPFLQKIASVLILPLTLAAFLTGHRLSNISGQPVTFNEIYAAYGTRSSVVLSDGSRVWLNSGSKLRYPDKFTGDKRLVYLTGEAFFEVHSDSKHPFIVKTPSVSVRATGTVFNVEALASQPHIRVSLLKGNVLVERVDGAVYKILHELHSNQMFSIDTVTGITRTESGDIYKYVAWKDGKMVFRNEPLSEVVKQISLKYNVAIELRGRELQDYRYRATFEEETLGDILNLLRLSSPVQIRELKRIMMPDGSFTKRKIIISPKGAPN